MEAVSPLPASLSTDPEESLKQFRRRYASVIETANAGTAEDISAVPEKRHSNRLFVRALPFAAALMLLLSSITAQAFGMNVFSVIARWTAEIFRLDGGSTPYATVSLRPLEVDEEATYQSLEEAMEAFGIRAPLAPKEIPERFELVKVTVNCRKTGILIYAEFKSSDGEGLIRYNEAEEQEFNTLERENSVITSYFAGRIDHKLISDMGRQKAVWRNGDFECEISGDFSEQELKTIIDSIYQE
ncbi:DUF4367 domain-containing protein [uncultured Oscillibacter sp.]|uniref:DUF4367 domain-containing protein n=1 Tax=uncultured Oscillibacter sp. TaxID=876091 RepID=UPI00260F65C5|nr:DUF4367 domain-containing protein [uncultured Oscillibacter sp.]